MIDDVQIRQIVSVQTEQVKRRKASGRWSPATKPTDHKARNARLARAARSASERHYRATQAESGEATTTTDDIRARTSAIKYIKHN